MRITTWNVNGLRAALRKGFADYLDVLQTDVLLLQEIRVRPEQLPKEWAEPDDWHVHWHPAVRGGYAGVAIWSREPFEVIGTGLDTADPEGRVLRVRIDDTDFVSVYLPSGSSGEHRQAAKEVWMDSFAPWMAERYNDGRPVVVGGDLNIAHTEQDIFYAKGNQKNSGFLPHERAWFGDLLTSGWRDLVREHFGDVQGPYSWWSNRGRARELDRGWRIDYLLGNQQIGEKFQSAEIHREAGLTISDHAPVTIVTD
ncbi:exodeoxyribonuclease III [Thalassoroseus pseudoceratinae]|uniref:exodeoxyribonuclease III n=1 Tax=Thalassoroseus pseudoceratinae TaxID=2713176 RepID=UPI00141FB1EC|nr:exodeoxyribonuclease III [Thalassoroseus pseudoceratinae]